MSGPIQSSSAAYVDGLVRSGRASGMTEDQIKVAGRNLIANIQDALSSNPFLTEFFPGLGDGLRALSGAIEVAIDDLSREVPTQLGETIQGEYNRIVGTDVFGRSQEIGPLLRRQLLDFASTYTGEPESLGEAIRAEILGSQEIKDARRNVVDSAYRELLGRAPTVDERNAHLANVDAGIQSGQSLMTLGQSMLQEISRLPEYALLERVGQVFQQVFSDHDAPDLATKRKWTDWVQSMMSTGYSESSALEALRTQLAGR